MKQYLGAVENPRTIVNVVNNRDGSGVPSLDAKKKAKLYEMASHIRREVFARQ